MLGASSAIRDFFFLNIITTFDFRTKGFVTYQNPNCLNIGDSFSCVCGSVFWLLQLDGPATRGVRCIQTSILIG